MSPVLSFCQLGHLWHSVCCRLLGHSDNSAGGKVSRRQAPLGQASSPLMVGAQLCICKEPDSQRGCYLFGCAVGRPLGGPLPSPAVVGGLLRGRRGRVGRDSSFESGVAGLPRTGLRQWPGSRAPEKGASGRPWSGLSPASTAGHVLSSPLILRVLFALRSLPSIHSSSFHPFLLPPIRPSSFHPSILLKPTGASACVAARATRATLLR